jgi:hypothetical protein
LYVFRVRACVSLLIISQPFVSTIGIAWTAYLSLTNSAEEA